MLHHVLGRRWCDQSEPEHPERGGAKRCASHGSALFVGRALVAYAGGYFIRVEAACARSQLRSHGRDAYHITAQPPADAIDGSSATATRVRLLAPPLPVDWPSN